MRIQINLNEEILNRVEEEAQRIGVSRGSMISTWVGEKINSIDQTRNMFRDLLDDKDYKNLIHKLIEEKGEK